MKAIDEFSDVLVKDDVNEDQIIEIINIISNIVHRIEQNTEI